MLSLAQIDADGSFVADVLPGLALVALGNGLAFAPTMIAATSGVPDEERGLASGVLSTAQELGTAVGLAALASVATTVTRASDHATAADASTAGYRAGFVAAAVLVTVAVVVAWRAPRQARSPEDTRTAPGPDDTGALATAPSPPTRHVQEVGSMDSPALPGRDPGAPVTTATVPGSTSSP